MGTKKSTHPRQRTSPRKQKKADQQLAASLAATEFEAAKLDTEVLSAESCQRRDATMQACLVVLNHDSEWMKSRCTSAAAVTTLLDLMDEAKAVSKWMQTTGKLLMTAGDRMCVTAAKVLGEHPEWNHVTPPAAAGVAEVLGEPALAQPTPEELIEESRQARLDGPRPDVSDLRHLFKLLMLLLTWHLAGINYRRDPSSHGARIARALASLAGDVQDAADSRRLLS